MAATSECLQTREAFNQPQSWPETAGRPALCRPGQDCMLCEASAMCGVAVCASRMADNQLPSLCWINSAHSTSCCSTAGLHHWPSEHVSPGSLQALLRSAIRDTSAQTTAAVHVNMQLCCVRLLRGYGLSQQVARLASASQIAGWLH